MNSNELNIKKYIVLLSTVIFGGMFSIVILHSIFNELNDNLDLEKENERTRIEIIEAIVEDINLIEKDFYNLFLTNMSQKKMALHTNIDLNIKNIYKAIDVLSKGGIYNKSYSAHSGDINGFFEAFEYSPNVKNKRVEEVNLIPRIKEISKNLGRITALIAQRDSLIANQINFNEFKIIKKKIFILSQKMNSNFDDIIWNTNSDFNKGLENLKAIDIEIENSKSKYKILEQVLLFFIALLMILISLKIIKEIKIINQVLVSARQELKTSLEELEQTNAQLTQEIGEKNLAEESLQLSENRLQLMWNSVHSGIFLIRKDNFEIIDCNPAASKMLGLRYENIVGSISHNFIINSEGGECDYNETNNVDKKDCYIMESNGRAIPILKTDVSINMNEIEFWLVSFTDVSILKKAEKALLKAKNQAENADKLKSIFIAQMSHEIRTPINVMLSMSSLLELESSDILDDEQNKYFGLIERAGNRITRTIDLLINLSEIQAGTYEPIIKSYDLYSDILSGLLVEYKKMAKDKNISLNINFDTENAQLHCDSYTVEQIFRQLLDNAIIYTEKGSIEVTVFRNMEQQLVTEIRDTGIGIDEKYLKDIFKPFTQEEMGYSRKYDGNGIGLSLVKSYCSLNNAEIEVESEKGVGSVFRVIFN